MSLAPSGSELGERADNDHQHRKDENESSRRTDFDQTNEDYHSFELLLEAKTRSLKTSIKV